MVVLALIFHLWFKLLSALCACNDFYQYGILSFPLNFVEKKNIYIGDIAISYEIVNQRSKASNFFLELDKMWIHGYFHLIGYDHKKLKDFREDFECTTGLKRTKVSIKGYKIKEEKLQISKTLPEKCSQKLFY